MDEVRRQVFEGRIELPRIGEVRRTSDSVQVPYAVFVDGSEVEPITTYLWSLVLSDVSPLTVRS